ncbi:MAG: shikimate kinase [Ectothiorhodospiraceae bacterium]|nr:shikimate kinase [Chromatiales bacterium]MCP5156473.1 shikimate kinase [Ectothiorhodospiraceae bacterium]
MGAGKTTVGRHLARALGKQFVDCDKELEARTGASIPLIFELEGEAGFRRREAAMLDELTQRDGIVLATGGGAVLAAENRGRLRARGVTIYLHAPIDLLVERTARDRNRPLLQTADPRARLTAIVTEREPLYREVADLVIKTDRRTARHVAREIMKGLEERC